MKRNSIDIKHDGWFASLEGVDKKNARILSKKLKRGEHLGICKDGALKIKKTHPFFHQLNVIGRRKEERAVGLRFRLL